MSAVSAISGGALGAGVTTTFDYDDARLIGDDEHEGGLVHRVGTAAKGALPLVVYLHGVNEKGPLHRGLAAPGFDLRDTADGLFADGAIGPLLLAGPSQTRDAWTGRRLWQGFDIERFADAVDASLAGSSTASMGGAMMKVDRARVILVGHSGAGCNPTGGILARSSLRPSAIVALDTCMDAEFGRAFGEAADVAPLHVFFQSVLWPREIDAFRTAFTATLAAKPGRVGSVTKLDVPGAANPHDEIVPAALAKLLPTLVPPPAD